MTTPRQDMRRLRWTTQCHDEIKQRGGNARIVIQIRGTPGKRQRQRLSAKGPCGEIASYSFDNKSIFIRFKADELLTSMAAVRANT